ncbi:MAG: hypothetical protein QM621_02725 [Aeromicrobium sp.]|uniref:hypothetical protein n=1 Tax=Aeromicrobium sp. TaxID=1871063 RepID=UPI0039E673C4
MFGAVGTYLGGGIEETLESMAQSNAAVLGLFGDNPTTGFLAAMISSTASPPPVTPSR